mmetsp:Transcript_119755/g.284520  ORF Transcript_119755/g.284520 Transcript_119755/m.284520 type:complete len:214 (-) Transcript_119755:1632-2273(-)
MALPTPSICTFHLPSLNFWDSDPVMPFLPWTPVKTIWVPVCSSDFILPFAFKSWESFSRSGQPPKGEFAIFSGRGRRSTVWRFFKASRSLVAASPSQSPATSAAFAPSDSACGSSSLIMPAVGVKMFARVSLSNFDGMTSGGGCILAQTNLTALVASSIVSRPSSTKLNTSFDPKLAQRIPMPPPTPPHMIVEESISGRLSAGKISFTEFAAT